MTERIKNIKINELIPFENHPFKARSGIEQEELSQSIKSGGLLAPIIIRSLSAGKYEIISGHRRVDICRELGLNTVPAIVKELTNEEAVIAMVDANLQRYIRLTHLVPKLLKMVDEGRIALTPAVEHHIDHPKFTLRV